MEESVSKRSRIQDAAVALFHEQGVEATSVNEIVRRANVAKGTFYVYYKDKKELISQILTKQHGCLMNDILNRFRKTLLLYWIQRNIGIWCLPISNACRIF